MTSAEREHLVALKAAREEELKKLVACEKAKSALELELIAERKARAELDAHASQQLTAAQHQLRAATDASQQLTSERDSALQRAEQLTARITQLTEQHHTQLHSHQQLTTEYHALQNTHRNTNQALHKARYEWMQMAHTKPHTKQWDVCMSDGMCGLVCGGGGSVECDKLRAECDSLQKELAGVNLEIDAERKTFAHANHQKKVQPNLFLPVCLLWFAIVSTQFSGVFWLNFTHVMCDVWVGCRTVGAPNGWSCAAPSNG